MSHPHGQMDSALEAFGSAPLALADMLRILVGRKAQAEIGPRIVTWMRALHEVEPR